MKDLNLIKKVAWSFHKSTGIEFEELFSEAALAYVEALQTYNPHKAKHSTWMVHNMRNHLITFCAKERKQASQFLFSQKYYMPAQKISFWRHYNEEKLEITSRENLERDYSFKEMLNDLPQDLKLICKIIFDAPEEILAGSAKAARGNLVTKLREQQWSWPRIWKSIRNMKAALNENTFFSII